MQALFVLVYECLSHPLLPSVSRRVCKTPTPALIYTSPVRGGPRRTLHPPALSYKVPSPVWICYFWTTSAFGSPRPISLFVCLYSFLCLHLLLLLPIPVSSPRLNLQCLRVRGLFFLLKTGFCSHFLCQSLPSFRDSPFLWTLPTISHTLYESFPFNFSRTHVQSLQTVFPLLFMFRYSLLGIESSRYYFYELHIRPCRFCPMRFWF